MNGDGTRGSGNSTEQNGSCVGTNSAERGCRSVGRSGSVSSSAGRSDGSSSVKSRTWARAGLEQAGLLLVRMEGHCRHCCHCRTLLLCP
jgi:hypothetical protein